MKPQTILNFEPWVTLGMLLLALVVLGLSAFCIVHPALGVVATFVITVVWALLLVFVFEKAHIRAITKDES